jgi:hypothetical protein
MHTGVDIIFKLVLENGKNFLKATKKLMCKSHARGLNLTSTTATSPYSLKRI